MEKFLDTDKFEQGDKASWFHDAEKKPISGIIVNVSDRLLDGEAVYTIKVDGYEHLKKEKALVKIPMTDIAVQKHNNITSHISIESSDFFSTITMATNYAHDKLEELRIKGMGHLVLSDPGLDTKIAKIKESFEFWETEYDRLLTMRQDLVL